MPDHADRPSARRVPTADHTARGAARSGKPGLSRAAALLSAAPPVAQLEKLGTHLSSATVPVVQRSVLTKYENNKLVYYSDLETAPKTGATAYATHGEAKIEDDKLAADGAAVPRGLYKGRKRTGGDKRVPTPFSYAQSSVTAKPTGQGPHSLSFASIEQRLTNRLRQGQQAELADQIPTAKQARKYMIAEHGMTDGSKELTRYLADLDSLTTEFHERLANDTNKGVGSAFHLVARKLLNMHPYAAFKSGGSGNRGEERHAPFGLKVIDTSHTFNNKKNAEKSLRKREDMYHSSDDERSNYKKKVKPYVYTSIDPTAAKYALKNREQRRRTRTGGASSTSVGSAPPTLAAIAPDASTTPTANVLIDLTPPASPSAGKKRKQPEPATPQVPVIPAHDAMDTTSTPAPDEEKRVEPATKKLRNPSGGAIDTTEGIATGAEESGRTDTARMESDD